MAFARRNGAEDSSTRTALIDAAEQLMVEEGYAAVSSRRVAGRAGMNAALVYYYFGTMDDLFLAVFSRRAERNLEAQAEALASDQPLWALWDVTRDQTNTALNFEFLALGKHRKVVGAAITESCFNFRRVQLDAMPGILKRYGVDADAWAPAVVLLLMDGMSRFLMMEEAFGLDIGHTEMIALIEGQIRALEGEPRSRKPRPRAKKRA